MGLFNNFPYTDFHRLNLDWILKFTKSVRDRLDLIDAAVTNAQAARDEAESYATNAENSATEAASSRDIAYQAASDAEDYKDAAAQSASDAEDAKIAAEAAQIAAEAAAQGIDLDGVICMQGKLLEVFTEQSAPPTVMPGCVAFDCELFDGIVDVTDMPVCIILPRGSHSTSTDHIKNNFGFTGFYAINPNNNHFIPCFQVIDTVTGTVPIDGTTVLCDVFVFPYAKNNNTVITGYVPS